MRSIVRIALVAVAMLLPDAPSVGEPALDTVETLGAVLLTDRNLSISRTQSCISCHSPNLAFTDPRALGSIRGAVSRGADGRSLGDRNAPTLLYSALAPDFAIDAQGQPRGGFFHDGRAATLEAQAAGPLLDPTEMAMPDKAAVAARIKEDPVYTAAFPRLFGDRVLEDPDLTFAAVTQALAAANRTAEFAPFSSRYDRSLKGDVQLTALESEGLALFFHRARCADCHAAGDSLRETFTNSGYFNLGVPVNRGVRAQNGSKPGHVDRGVRTARPDIPAAHDGKFKVPTLRNVAVTGPYLHNGLMANLRTVILFHNRWSSPDAAARPNPETGRAWDEPEVPGTVDREKLALAPTLTEAEIDALLAFLATLTDAGFESLLPKS